jgi:predicted nucleotide-binding protein
MTTSFPKTTLQQALDIPHALMRNGGNPLSAIDLATAIGKSPGSSTIRTLSAASSAYGLTGGGLKSTTNMEALGQAITSPKSPAEKARSLVAAALNPPSFKAVYDYYKGKKVPERDFLVNTLVREFGVAAGRAAETFAEIFLANMEFVGLTRTTPGGEWLTNDPTAAQIAHEAPSGDNGGVGPEEDVSETPDLQDSPPGQPPPTLAPAAPEKRKRPNKLFVGHGRNKKPLEQLTKILRDLGIPYLVAEDEANVGRPISQKVRDTMDQCGAAILIFSADIEHFDKDGKPIWHSSENVSHELGASAVMYDDRVILFKEQAVDLASNFSGIGYIPFEKDRLDAEMSALLRELVALRFLKLSVGDDD